MWSFSLLANFILADNALSCLFFIYLFTYNMHSVTYTIIQCFSVSTAADHGNATIFFLVPQSMGWVLGRMLSPKRLYE
jgi:hypothetical protein